MPTKIVVAVSNNVAPRVASEIIARLQSLQMEVSIGTGAELLVDESGPLEVDLRSEDALVSVERR